MKKRRTVILWTAVITGLLLLGSRTIAVATYRTADSCGGGNPIRLSIVGGDLERFYSAKEEDADYLKQKRERAEDARRQGLPVLPHGCRLTGTYQLYLW